MKFLFPLLLTAASAGYCATGCASADPPIAPANATGRKCCKALSAIFDSKIAFRHTPTYAARMQSYWAKQEADISPACVFLAASAQDVARALEVLVPLSCLFAVRGGGAGSVPGIANIQDGVTIDLGAMRDVALNQDKSLVSLGPGLNWSSVYGKLDAFGLSVPGSREGPAGVGGLALGGGFSYFASKAGFLAENIVAYQVVLANGSITTASSTDNHDLWMALKGGSSNFGIVTRFTIRTFALGRIWAGDSYYPTSSLNAHIKALFDFCADPDYDPDAGYFLNYAYTPSTKLILANRVAYAKPVVNPSAFHQITSVPGQLSNTTKIQNLAGFSVENGEKAPAGYRQLMWTTTFHNNLDMLEELWNIFNASTDTVAGVHNVTWSLTLEPLVPAIAAQTKARGGNVLGLDHVPANGLILCQLSATWVSPRDNSKMQAASDLLLAQIIHLAEKKGLHHRYVDMNHADRSQNPIDGYGPENAAFLRATAKRFDPERVFQKLMPGGFKL